MRQVSITRNRSFVGCAVKLKVYVEDAAAEEITIQNVPCRKLGTLKNGETATFEVPVQEVRIFVIADKLSKDICCDVYRLSAGEDAVSLSGKCRFSLATQNAFRFDNNNTQEAQALLKKNKKKGTAVFVCCILLGVVIGLVSSGIFFPAAPKTFVTPEMTITLTDDFTEGEYEPFVHMFSSRNLSVMTLKETFESAPGIESYSKKEYAQLFAQANNLDSVPTVREGTVSFTYSQTDDAGTKHCYAAYVYKTKDAFWVVQFGTTAADFEAQQENIDTYAKSISFS